LRTVVKHVYAVLFVFAATVTVGDTTQEAVLNLFDTTGQVRLFSYCHIVIFAVIIIVRSSSSSSSAIKVAARRYFLVIRYVSFKNANIRR
jgi:hypothetical protein